MKASAFAVVKAFVFSAMMVPFVSFAATSLKWSEMTEPGIYHLNEDVTLQGRLSFHNGEKFRLLEASGLGSVAADYYELQALKCTQPEREIKDFEMVRPSQTPAGQDGSVGILLDKHCHLRIYVDVRDFELPSLFVD